MLIPLNLKNADNIALSVVRTSDGYSVVPCNIVNGYGLSELPSYWANRKSTTDESGFDIDPIAVFDFHADMEVSGPDLYECIEKCLEKIEELYNQ